MKYLHTIFAVLILSAITILPAQALPVISGSIGFSGAMAPEDNGGNAVNLGAATQLNLTDVYVSQVPTGAFATEGVNKFDAVSMSLFTLGGSADPLWTTGGFTFELLNSTVNAQNDTFINVSGNGILRHANYEDTYGSWYLSGNPLGEGNFNFSAGSVPAPAALGLIGLGLLGFSASRRIKKKSQ